MIYPIVAYGHPVLKKEGEDIEKGEIDVKELAEDMFETMHAAKGIGLAAPQIGKSLRMFIADATPLEDEEIGDWKQVFINPEISEEYGDDWTFEEGCLSIPNIREDVVRAEKLKIHYYDENWDEHTEVFEGIKARIIQHEYDHLDGILFTDHLSAFKKRLLKSKLTGISKGIVKVEYRMSFPAKNKPLTRSIN
ncbi:MAG: peptide deformylase [Cyclobacteriaceae bacterium]|nr:peptide deformylase [Cyclobacteriaceae bacterium]MCK5281267.1 peptide deformylase [Cyclobacteriaceae bacterium]MCK5368956.1 peptide deformylase [Cyclobacteriaceae bacterium]MCK5704105.1 peptide deformylase [Cyclobacteriaceae bacterium]